MFLVVINIITCAYTLPGFYHNTNSIIIKNKVRWEPANNISPIIAKYFKLNNNNIKREYNQGHLFCIDGIPAAAFIIDNTYIKIERFYLNKNLLLMFDAGPEMRFTFYKKFKHLSMENSINKSDFLII